MGEGEGGGGDWELSDSRALGPVCTLSKRLSKRSTLCRPNKPQETRGGVDLEHVELRDHGNNDHRRDVNAGDGQ